MSRLAQKNSVFWLQESPLTIIQALKKEVITEGRELFDLSMINPDIKPHREIVDAFIRAVLKGDSHRYSVSKGIRKLRQAFAHKYESAFGVVLDPDTEICVTMGCKGAVLRILTVVRPSCPAILLGEPLYPAYISAAKLHRMKIETFPVSLDESYMLQCIKDKLKHTDIGIVLLNFPSNPGGITVSQTFWDEISALAYNHNCIVANDFTYGELLFEGNAESLLASSKSKKNLLEIYSMSKAYCIPGWRIACLAGDAAIVESVSQLKSHIDYGIFIPAQLGAGVGLMLPDGVEAPKRAYKSRINILCKALKQHEWEIDPPKGGACVWGKMPPSLVQKFTLSQSGRTPSLQFAMSLLRDRGIAVMPGEVFGSKFGEYARFAAVLPENRLKKAVESLAEYISG
ncbi:MAG: aminotransferase class I/II-fold pyridoxal phosphate-dependent enzyme [Candidatus Dadabacteria bacterium]|nr:MAG: aminotransferase class I/II-fold pyridoxal phosphate-dependent enzyme [Candidatus Dadabacteria bacterium]